MLNLHPERAFRGVTRLLFAASVAATVAWCASMSSMPGMPMAGNWTMSMTWMRMPGQGWPGAAASFLGMWTVMMVAMMLPALVPMLRRYRLAIGPMAGVRLGALTLYVGAAYFAVWVALGLIVFPFGVALATLAMRVPAIASAVPVVTGLAVILGGASQFTDWKARQLACCHGLPAKDARLAADASTAWRHGLRLGIRCIHCCAGLTAILFVLGVMDLWVMTAVAAAITLERRVTARVRAARGIGAVAVLTGVALLGHAIAA